MEKQKYNIMIVDDARLSRELLKWIINKTDFARVEYESSNGSEALDIVKTYRPDLIFMDLVMPGLSGIQTIQKLTEINNSIPIIAISAIEEEELIFKATKFGAEEFIQKPFDEENIINILMKILFKNKN